MLFSPIPITISKERRDLLVLGKTIPDTFTEFQFWTYNYVIYQKKNNLENPLIQDLVRFAGGEITKKIFRTGDIYFDITTSYNKEEPNDWKNMLQNFITHNI